MPKGKLTQWSRVKHRSQFDAKRVVVFDFQTDLLKLRKDKLYTTMLEHNPDQFLFEPDTFEKDEANYNLEENKPSAEEI